MTDQMPATPVYRFKSLESAEWISRMNAHKEKLSPIIDPYLKKRSEQKKDPVLDFLFEYYKFRPSHLMRWSPGAGTILKLDESPDALPEVSELKVDGQSAFLNPDLFPKKRHQAATWIRDLLVKTNQSKPFFGCMGMHEWAMVYKAGDIRHSQVPLRLPDDEIAAVVESRPLLCTHFDAFRFFTDEARPLNKNELTRDTFQDNEQPGCIHTNMDIYKWAYKLYPWISSDVIREAFLPAVEARTIDMKASPYDLQNRGLEPIRIETEAGRKEYLEHQTAIWERGLPIREKLIEAYDTLFSLLD
jgi:hypothetical protein